MIYELKKYIAYQDKYEALLSRFSAKTMPIFNRLGIEVLHCWTSPDEPGAFFYLTRFPTDEARSAAWNAFAADAEWKQIKAQSEVGGPLLASQSTVYLQSTEFSPHG
jgi:NIPSNAP